MAFRFSQRSLNNLAEVHPDLQAIAHKALELTSTDFAVIEGQRTEAEQREMVRKGVSWTMDSRHRTGHAIDTMAYVNGKGRWEANLYHEIGRAFKSAAAQLTGKYADKVITWGGDWSVRDYGHIELHKATYPKGSPNISYLLEDRLIAATDDAEKAEPVLTQGEVARMIETALLNHLREDH